MTLRYVGPRLSTGEIERSLVYSGIPALDEIDETTLTDEQRERAIASGLYEPVKAKTKATEEKE